MKIHPNKDTSGLNECIRCAHTQRTVPSQCSNKIRRCVCQSSVGETGRATAEELKPGAPCVHACDVRASIVRAKFATVGPSGCLPGRFRSLPRRVDGCWQGAKRFTAGHSQTLCLGSVTTRKGRKGVCCNSGRWWHNISSYKLLL